MAKGPKEMATLQMPGWVLQPPTVADMEVLLARAEDGCSSMPQQLLGYDPDV